MFIICLLILNVSSMKWTKEDEVDGFSTDNESINERFYEILDEIESFDPTPQTYRTCRLRCQDCRLACARTTLPPVLKRRCQLRCYRL